MSKFSINHKFDLESKLSVRIIRVVNGVKECDYFHAYFLSTLRQLVEWDNENPYNKNDMELYRKHLLLRIYELSIQGEYDMHDFHDDLLEYIASLEEIKQIAENEIDTNQPLRYLIVLLLDAENPSALLIKNYDLWK